MFLLIKYVSYPGVHAIFQLRRGFPFYEKLRKFLTLSHPNNLLKPFIIAIPFSFYIFI
jgi:hypothetical protein